MEATTETSERRAEPQADAQLKMPLAAPTPEAEAESTKASEGEAAAAAPDRRRIEEQLDALKRRESELRRALAIADHPELAETIRALEGRAYAVARVDAKIAQGLSKSEERRLETLHKKLAALREKRAELDTQIGTLTAEAVTLGEARTQAFDAERREALQGLMTTMSSHEDALRTAGLDAASLVPDIARLMPEIVALAEQLVASDPRR